MSNNEDFPLMNRLFAVSALRQRYLAHVRTVLNENFGTNVNDKIDVSSCKHRFYFIDGEDHTEKLIIR